MDFRTFKTVFPPVPRQNLRFVFCPSLFFQKKFFVFGHHFPNMFSCDLPKHFFYESNFSCDSGVFVMKFIELWSPRILLSNLLSNENICNIRVQYANRIFFHEKNQMLQTEIQNVVLNWFDSVSISTIFFSFVLFIFFS